MIAHDDIVSKDKKISAKNASPEAQQSWLMFHDRWTSGIPGCMPLILGCLFASLASLNEAIG